MLDKWLADLAEGNMEKTASAQFGEALEQLSVDELQAIYELQGQKIKEAGWAGRAIGAGLGGAGGAAGGAVTGAGLGGAMGVLSAPSDRRTEGFWRGAGRGALLGAGVGGAGGALSGGAIGGAVQRNIGNLTDAASTGGIINKMRALGDLAPDLSRGEQAALLGGGALGGVAAPAASAIGGGIHGANTDPRQPVQRSVVATTKLKKKKEKKSHDLRYELMKNASLRGRLKSGLERLKSIGKKEEPKKERWWRDPAKRRRVVAAGGIGVAGGAVGYGVGRYGGRKEKKSYDQYQYELMKEAAIREKLHQAVKKIKSLVRREPEPAPKSKTLKRIGVAAGVGALGGAGYAGYRHYKNKEKKSHDLRSLVIKEAAKRGLGTRILEGIGGVGLGKQRKEVSKLKEHAHAADKTFRELEQGPFRGDPGARKAVEGSIEDYTGALKGYRERAQGRGVKALVGGGAATGIAGAGAGGYYLGKRSKEKRSSVDVMKMAVMNSN